MKPLDEQAMRRHWDEEAPGYIRGRKFSAADARALEIMQLQIGERLLEIGFGPGLTARRILQQYPQAEYVGLEFSAEFIRLTRPLLSARAHIVKGNALAIPFQAGSFDWILEMDAIHHFPQRFLFAVVGEVARVLKSGGHCLLVEDWAFPLESERERLADAIQRRRCLVSRGLEYHPSEAEWQKLLENAGLTVLHIERVVRPLNLQRFEELADPKSRADLARLRELWNGEIPTTKMSLILSGKPPCKP